MTPNQLAIGVLVILICGMTCGVIAFHRGMPRRWGYAVLCVVAAVSIVSWTNNGKFKQLSVDADRANTSPTRPKVKQDRPFHFHEFVHYYIGAKYFSELGYRGLYDCITLADAEIASEDNRQPKISGWIRDLDDVLTDKAYARSLADCSSEQRPRFSPARWAGFKSDIRELARLVDDNVWQSVVFDAGFNPPPTFVVVSSAFTNLIPITSASGETPTYLLATGLDLVLLLVCFVVFRSSFGRITAMLAASFFGASFLAHFSWNIGSVLRFSWFVAVVCGLAMMKRGRWTLAGVLLAVATCDRLFPAAFAAFALVPIALRARRSVAHRAILRKFGIGFAATTVALVGISIVFFGFGVWGTFLSRIGHHGDIYFVMHVGMKKIFTRGVNPFQIGNSHEGLANFRDWNLRLRAAWASLRIVVVPIQLLIVAGTVWASARRRPYEAGMLGGIVFMFFFNLPANYYYVILAIIPALLFRAAATAPKREGKFRSFAAFAAFTVFWMFTLVAPQLAQVIGFNFYICCALGIALVLWIVAWAEKSTLVEFRELVAIAKARVGKKA